MNKVVRFIAQLFCGCLLLGFYFIIKYMCVVGKTDVFILGTLALVGVGFLVGKTVKFIEANEGDKNE